MPGESKYVLKTPLMKRLRQRLATTPYAGEAPLVLAVSGGRDSCVLLDVFWRMRHVHQSEFTVLHVNHHTGDYAEAACQWVTDRCDALAIPCHVVDFHWNGVGNFEKEASQFRRDCLRQACGEHGYAVLAHHSQDQGETLIMALARGAGIASPLGMAFERDRRLRPFLDVPVAMIAEHAAMADVSWVEDPSNEDLMRFRNAVRRQVIPVLTGFHEHAPDRMSAWLEEYHGLQAQLRQVAATRLDQDGWAGGPEQGWRLQRTVFRRKESFLWPFMLALLWERLGIEKPRRRDHLQLMKWLEEDGIGGLDYLGGRIYCDRDAIIFTDRPELSPRRGRLNQAIDWGLWRLRLLWPGPELPWTAQLRTEGFQLYGGAPLPKSWRERLRRAQTPLRIRQHLPALQVGETKIHFGELLALQSKGHIRLVRESGPDWHC